MKKLLGVIALLFVITQTGIHAQALKQFSAVVQPKAADSKCYLSLQKGSVFAEKEAIGVKSEIDFVYQYSASGGGSVKKEIKKEFYNMSGKDIDLPAALTGTKTGIVALSWDKDLVDKCNTVADLKRMTASYNKNSFSFYATFCSNSTGDIDTHYYIFMLENGKMGIMELDKAEGNDVAIKVKMEP